jgi:hypothetical protein
MFSMTVIFNCKFLFIPQIPPFTDISKPLPKYVCRPGALHHIFVSSNSNNNHENDVTYIYQPRSGTLPSACGKLVAFIGPSYQLKQFWQ